MVIKRLTFLKKRLKSIADNISVDHKRLKRITDNLLEKD